MVYTDRLSHTKGRNHGTQAHESARQKKATGGSGNLEVY